MNFVLLSLLGLSFFICIVEKFFPLYPDIYPDILFVRVPWTYPRASVLSMWSLNVSLDSQIGNNMLLMVSELDSLRGGRKAVYKTVLKRKK